MSYDNLDARLTSLGDLLEDWEKELGITQDDLKPDPGGSTESHKGWEIEEERQKGQECVLQKQREGMTLAEAQKACGVKGPEEQTPPPQQVQKGPEAKPPYQDSKPFLGKKGHDGKWEQLIGPFDVERWDQTLGLEEGHAVYDSRTQLWYDVDAKDDMAKAARNYPNTREGYQAFMEDCSSESVGGDESCAQAWMQVYGSTFDTKDQEEPLWFKCMACGKWHKDGSAILQKHVTQYFRGGGTYYLDQWKTHRGQTAPREETWHDADEGCVEKEFQRLKKFAGEGKYDLAALSDEELRSRAQKICSGEDSAQDQVVESHSEYMQRCQEEFGKSEAECEELWKTYAGQISTAKVMGGDEAQEQETSPTVPVIAEESLTEEQKVALVECINQRMSQIPNEDSENAKAECLRTISQIGLTGDSAKDSVGQEWQYAYKIPEKNPVAREHATRKARDAVDQKHREDREKNLLSTRREGTTGRHIK